MAPEPGSGAIRIFLVRPDAKLKSERPEGLKAVTATEYESESAFKPFRDNSGQFDGSPPQSAEAS